LRLVLAGLLMAIAAPPRRPGTLRPGAGMAVGRSAAAQAAVDDAGSFTILQAGVKVGREVFTIQQTPPPDGGYVVQGSAVYVTRRLVPVLRTDSAGTPLRYEVDEFVGERRQAQLTLNVARGRGSERTQTRGGESAKEFRVGVGARLLDDDVFAQYYFIARAMVLAQPLTPGRAMVMTLLVPRRGGTVAAPVSIIGNEHLDIGGQSRTAVHIRIDPPGGEPRDIWADIQGRLLRVAIPARGLVAVRDDVPS
jgi:hypothetical protein